MLDDKEVGKRIRDRLRADRRAEEEARQLKAKQAKAETQECGDNAVKKRVFWMHDLVAAKKAKKDEEAINSRPDAKRRGKGKHKRSWQDSDAMMAKHISTPTMPGSTLGKLRQIEAKPVDIAARLLVSPTKKE